MRIPSGVTDQVIYFVAVDSVDFTSRETGLATFTARRSRNGGASTLYTTPTIAELGGVGDMDGVYSLLLDEDMTIAAGNDSEEFCVHITHAGMAPVTRTFELYRPKITAGETVTATGGAVNSDCQLIEGVDATDQINAACDTALSDYDGPTNAEMVARTLVAASYFDPAVDVVANVTTVATLTGHTAQTGDSFARLGAPAGVSVSADIADVPTVAEFNARTLLAASYFDPAADTVVNVTTVATLTGHTAQTGDNFARLGAPVAASISADIAVNLAAIAALNDLAAADILTQVNAGWATAITEPIQALPPTTAVATRDDAVRYMYFGMTNQVVSDGVLNELQFFDRAALNIQWKKALTDAASISTEASGIAGP